MSCGWSRQGAAAGGWSPRTRQSEIWTAQGAPAAAWAPDPIVLILDDGGTFKTDDCTPLHVEAVDG